MMIATKPDNYWQECWDGPKQLLRRKLKSMGRKLK